MFSHSVWPANFYQAAPVSVRLRGKVIGGSALAFGTLLVFHVVAAVVGVRLLTMLARK